MRYFDLLKEGKAYLEQHGISPEDSATDAWLLFSKAFSMSRSVYFLHQMDTVGEEQQEGIARYQTGLQRRGNREPVQYLLEEQWFYGRDFYVNPAVLIPRLDTEVLVERILKDGRSGNLLDLCTGSGCIAVSLLASGQFSKGVATDISEAALQVAEKNAKRHGVELKLLQGDLWEALIQGEDNYEDYFDVIVSNPPYVRNDELPELLPEVAEHEPHLALFAPGDGCLFYDRILQEAKKYLKKDGWIYFEIGCEQGRRVLELFIQWGYRDIGVLQDLAGKDRVVFGRNPGKE